MLKWLASRFEKHRAGLQARLEQSLQASTQAPAPIFKPNWQKLGNEALDAGNLVDALRCYENVLKNLPDDVDALVGLAFVKSELQTFAEAKRLLERAVVLDAANMDAWFMLGGLHERDKHLVKAQECYVRAIQLQPEFLPAHLNLGLVLHKQGDSLAAIDIFQKALNLSPNDPQLLSNLGGAFQLSGQLKSAIASYREALAQHPDYLPAQQNLLYALSFSADCSPADYLSEARKFGAKVSALARPYSHGLTAQEGDRPLRVGFVSGDLRNHAVGYFLENVVAKIRPERFALVAYANWPQEDALTLRIKPFFTEWHQIEALSDESLAAKIQADSIDILLDLSGHTAANRLSLFAWRAAPVQVAWLGYWASTGIAEIDFVLVDKVAVPDPEYLQFTEKIWCLPEIRYCLTAPPIDQLGAVTTLPALRNGYVTFASFQVLSKINDAVLLIWSQILAALPGARFRLQNWQFGSPSGKAHFLQRLHQLGINSTPFDLLAGSNRQDYLASYAQIDVVLDTFPFPGGTTTIEALWMGVPTLTLSGKSLLARQGESILRCAGLADWVVHNEHDYVIQTMTHVQNLQQLSKLRANLRQQVAATKLVDAEKFALDFENALLGIWRQKQLELKSVEKI
jgi:predicted O-linked N-acetylglucosamine transferase (SPINDLY family)